MKGSFGLFVAASVLLIVSESKANDSRLVLSGYLKNFSVIYDQPSVGGFPGSAGAPVMGMSSNRLRVDLACDHNKLFGTEAAYYVIPRIQDNALFYYQPTPTAVNQSGYRVADLDSRLYPARRDTAGSFAVFQNLDRLLLSIRAAKFDLYIGRQAIAWGSARVINPTDIFIPYKFEDLDTEERIGVDAVRLRAPLGRLSEIDAGAVFGKNFKTEQSAVFARAKFNKMESDFSTLLISFRKNLLWGLDIISSVKGAGVWLETAYVWADAFDERHGSGNDYLRTSIGCDYSFSGKTYGFIEYHYNQAGSSNPSKYLSLFTKTAYTDGADYFLGKSYLIPGITYQISTPFLYSGQVLTNLDDPSVYFTSTVDYSYNNNVQLTAGYFLALGKKPSAILLPAPTVLYESEFGSYPNIYFMSFNLYF